MARAGFVLLGFLVFVAGCSRGTKVESAPRAPGTVGIRTDASTVDTGSSKKSTAATLGIPPGHLPPPGQCRVWMPGRPPGHQGPSGSCAHLERRVPPGGWLVYRPSESKKHVKVWAYDSGSSAVMWIRWFDAATGAFLREERS